MSDTINDDAAKWAVEASRLTGELIDLRAVAKQLAEACQAVMNVFTVVKYRQGCECSYCKPLHPVASALAAYHALGIKE